MSSEILIFNGSQLMHKKKGTEGPLGTKKMAESCWSDGSSAGTYTILIAFWWLLLVLSPGLLACSRQGHGREVQRNSSGGRHRFGFGRSHGQADWKKHALITATWGTLGLRAAAGDPLWLLAKRAMQTSSLDSCRLMAGQQEEYELDEEGGWRVMRAAQKLARGTSTLLLAGGQGVRDATGPGTPSDLQIRSWLR
ncbi:hypothetical protein B0J14DRAFT_566249 [Halenospora varia]|nr:hypothetical protein B0J14DRAFT_566249 [Halenospora varia]